MLAMSSVVVLNFLSQRFPLSSQILRQTKIEQKPEPPTLNKLLLLIKSAISSSQKTQLQSNEKINNTKDKITQHQNVSTLLKTSNTFHSPRLAGRAANGPQSAFTVDEEQKIIVHSSTLNINTQSSEEKLRQIQEVASEYNVQNYNLEEKTANKIIQSSQNARSDTKKQTQELKKDSFYPQNQLKKPTKLPSSRDVMKQIQPDKNSANQQQTKKIEEKPFNSLTISHQTSIQTQIKIDNRATAEDDDFIDDILDDSMELRESQTQTHTSNTKSKFNSGITTSKANQSTPSNNKINTTSPSKLNSKFTSSAGAISRTQFSASNSSTNQQSKNQIKQSVVQGKKTLQSLMQDKDLIHDSKTITQLDLNLSMTNLSKIPKEQLNNTNLRSIDIRNNKITSDGIPDELFLLENVWKLQLDNNLIQTLPDLFETMICLRQFTISQNQLEKLPQSLFKLKNLEKLDISSNKIQLIPSTINQLQNLKYLFMIDNSLTILPKSIGQLINLQQISVEWFMYLEPLFDKLIKRIVPIPTQQSKDNNKLMEESALILIQEALNQCKKDQVNFFDFIQSFYKKNTIKDVFQTLKLNKGSTLIHQICKYQHLHIFDLLKEYKQHIDINMGDLNGQSPLMVAISEKSSTITDKILREFKEQLDLDYNGQIEEDNDQSTPTKNQNKQSTIVLHPLILSLRNQLYETALRIFNIMVKNHNKANQQKILNLNMKDENNFSIMHYLFMNFSTNMEQSVELCQEILKQYERGQKNIPASVELRLNDQNKQGMTPFDLAIEVKQNQAIEFAIYYNKNLLPAFQQSKTKIKKEQFDLNFNKNVRGLTPLHRAIMNLNYKAIYLLLQSGDCNLYIKDRDFKTARDYCLLKQFLNKYLRKGESNIIRNIVAKQYCDRMREFEKQIQPNKTDKRGYHMKAGILVKNVQHNNINFFQMSVRRGNRVKYNSWYTRINQNNGLNGQHNYSKNDNATSLHLNSQQVTHEQKEGDNDEDESDEDQIRIEDVKDEEDENLLKANSYVQDSIVKINLMIGEDQELKPNRPVDRKANSLLKPTIQQTNNINERRLSDQQQQLLTSKKSNTQGLTQKQNIIQTQTKTIQSTNHSQKASITSKLSPRSQNLTHEQQKIRGSQPITEVVTFDIQQKINSVEIREGSVLSMKRDSEEFNIAEEENDQEENGNEESPSTLPSNKYKYVMAVNNSKLARKPYYKQIQRNRFEREFCIIMDSRVEFSEKLNKLFSVFSQVQQNINHPQKDISNGFYRDGREFLGFLKLELDSKEFNLQPLRNEILYFQEIIFGNQSLAIMINDGNQSARKNTNNNFSLERGPLPMIQEAQQENTNISPQKKFLAQPTANKFGFKSMNKTSTNSRQNFSSIQATEQLEEDKSQAALRLNTATSSKNLDQSKQQNSSATTVSRKAKVNEVKLVNMKNLVSGSQDEDGAKSPTSPRGNSGQINQKLNQTTTTIQLQSPQSNYGGTLTFQPQASLKTKDSLVKKIEVQITEKQQQPISMSSPQDKTSNGKWKQLTINPNNNNNISNNSSTQNISISGVAKGLQKINSKLSNTPQSQRANQQILSLMTNAQTQNSSSSLNTNRNTLNLQNTQAKINEGSNIIISTASQNKTSSSLSNRSSSNPRNSLIGTTTNNLKQQVQKPQPSINNPQQTLQMPNANISTAKVSYVSFQVKNQNMTIGSNTNTNTALAQNESQPFAISSSQPANNNTNHNNTSATLTQFSMNQQSKLKAPASKNYNRHTIGKTTGSNITSKK